MQDHQVPYSVQHVHGGGGNAGGGGGGYPVVSYLLQQTLRRLCTDSDWIYAVFWRILPRNYPPPKWDSESSLLDRSKGNKRNWILVWEDGFCDFAACARSSGTSSSNNEQGMVAAAASTSPAAAEHVYQSSSSPTSRSSSSGGGAQPLAISAADHHHPHHHCMQPELFFKMSHDVYNYGEGLMGKVAADNSHKWIYKEPTEADSQYPPSWQGALDPHPRTWEAQFSSGIETIAIVAVKEGLLQLGSLRKTTEDLNFVLFLQRKFNYLQSIPGVYAVHPVQLLQQHAAPLPLGANARRTAPEPDEPPPQHALHATSAAGYPRQHGGFYADVEQAAGTSLQTLLSRLPSVPPLTRDSALLYGPPMNQAGNNNSSNNNNPVSPRSYAPGNLLAHRSSPGIYPSPSSSPPAAAAHLYVHQQPGLSAAAQYSIDQFAAPAPSSYPYYASGAQHATPSHVNPALYSTSSGYTALGLAHPNLPDAEDPSP